MEREKEGDIHMHFKIVEGEINMIYDINGFW